MHPIVYEIRDALRGHYPDSEALSLAKMLLTEVFGFSTLELYGGKDKEISGNRLRDLHEMLSRLKKNEPIQYIIGTESFCGLTFEVNPNVLIPRPETQELVRWIEADWKSVPCRILDVGTGSGCIILSLAKEFGKGVFLGTDISAEAITLARENAAMCGLDGVVKLAVADGLDEFDPESLDVIVSNPPYITTADCETLDPRVKDYEPRSALDGGVSGLDFYERFIGDAMNVLKPGGALFFEIGDGQGEALRELFEAYGFSNIKIEKDFSGHDRYASGRL
jgi:release factor glutamine methyltransferase